MLGKKTFLAGLTVCFVVPIIWGMATEAQGKFIEERLAEVEARIAKLEEKSTVTIANFERVLDIQQRLYLLSLRFLCGLLYLSLTPLDIWSKRPCLSVRHF